MVHTFISISLIYPPCPVSALLASSSLDAPRQAHVISVGQFRPEKDHERQLRAFALFLQSPFVQHRTSGSPTTAASGRAMATRSTAALPSRPTLFLVGGCRDAQDEARVAALRALAVELGIQHSVQFHVNVDSTELTRLLTTSLVCLHTMWNEHFGISCVESMAAGTVLIAHNSGGPRADIVVDDGGMCESVIDKCSCGACARCGSPGWSSSLCPRVQGYQPVIWPPHPKNMRNAWNLYLQPTFPCQPDRSTRHGPIAIANCWPCGRPRSVGRACSLMKCLSNGFASVSQRSCESRQAHGDLLYEACRHVYIKRCVALPAVCV